MPYKTFLLPGIDAIQNVGGTWHACSVVTKRAKDWWKNPTWLWPIFSGVKNQSNNKTTATQGQLIDGFDPSSLLLQTCTVWCIRRSYALTSLRRAWSAPATGTSIFESRFQHADVVNAQYHFASPPRPDRSLTRVQNVMMWRHTATTRTTNSSVNRTFPRGDWPGQVWYFSFLAKWRTTLLDLPLTFRSLPLPPTT